MLTPTVETIEAPTANAANLAALKQYLTEDTYRRLTTFAYYLRPYAQWVYYKGVRKTNITGAWEASNLVNEAVLRVIESKESYAGPSHAMGAYLKRAIGNVLVDRKRRVSLERLARAAMVMQQILEERASIPRGTPALVEGSAADDDAAPDQATTYPQLTVGPVGPERGERVVAPKAFAAPHIGPAPDALSEAILKQESERLELARRAAGVSDTDWMDYLRHTEDGQPCAQIAREWGKPTSTVTRRFAKIATLVNQRLAEPPTDRATKDPTHPSFILKGRVNYKGGTADTAPTAQQQQAAAKALRLLVQRRFTNLRPRRKR